MSVRPATSWIVVRRATGEAIMETFSRRVAEAVNQAAYAVVPIGEYLASLNHKAQP